MKQSRLTFRDKVDVCWQKQLRDQYLEEGVPDVDLSLKNAVVRPVSRKLAAQIILKYEWLGTMANTKWHYGIFFDNYCAGVCCIGKSSLLAGAYLHHQFRIKTNDLIVLARGANVHWSPIGANSKLISWAIKLCYQETTAKIIIAFSDSDAGEIGTIYQACNWSYIGCGRNSRPDGEFIAPNNRAFNRRIVGQVARKNKIRYLQAKELMLKEGWQMQPENVKHRYIYILDKKDKALINRVKAMRQPYPKRADS